LKDAPLFGAAQRARQFHAKLNASCAPLLAAHSKMIANAQKLRRFGGNREGETRRSRCRIFNSVNVV
jgi:hypothetical protein